MKLKNAVYLSLNYKRTGSKAELKRMFDTTIIKHEVPL